MSCLRQPVDPDVAPRERHRLVRTLDALENEPGAAAHIEEAPGAWEVAPEYFLHQPEAGMEPEVPALGDPDLPVEIRGVSPVPAVRSHAKDGKAIAIDWRGLTRRAGPSNRVKPTPTRQAHLHDNVASPIPVRP